MIFMKKSLFMELKQFLHTYTHRKILQFHYIMLCRTLLLCICRKIKFASSKKILMDARFNCAMTLMSPLLVNHTHNSFTFQLI